MAKTVGKPGLMKLKKSTCAKDVREGAVAFGKAIAKDNRFHYGRGDDAHHNGCYFCGTQPGVKRRAGIKDYQLTYCCNPFIHACYSHGGGEPKMLTICKHGSSYGFSANEGYAASTVFRRLHPSGVKDLIPGDVMCSSHHVKMYIGDKKCVEAGGGDDNVKNSKKWNHSIRISSCTSIGSYRCYRYTGKGGGWMCLPTKSGGTRNENGRIVATKAQYAGWTGISKDGKVKIGEAAADSDGRSGDSGGGEVAVKNWYGYSSSSGSYKNWTYVFRFKDTEKALKASKIIYDACKNNNVGYKRGVTTFYTELKKCKYDASKIKNKCDSACSQLIAAAVKAVGVDVKLNVSALGLKDTLKASKAFKIYTAKAYTQSASKAQPGDIYITAHSNGANNHAMMIVQTKKGLPGYSTGTSSSSNEALGITGSFVDDGRSLVLENEIAQLYSSQNYSYLEGNKEDDEEATKFKSQIYKSLVEGLNRADSDDAITGAVLEVPAEVSGLSLPAVDYQKNKPALMKSANKGSLLTFPTYVEAPTIVLDFNGIKIGGYGNRGDRYPNYITGMIVDKINGRINNYSITLTYQVRPGEDPNFIDKLISRTGYRNPLKILYGDSMYDGDYFREEEAVIVDARHSEDIGSYRVSYTIKAISSVGITPAAFQSFSAKTDKPSNSIYDLLYNSGQASKTLLTMFPGMQNRTAVASAGLIPTTDSVVNLSSMNNVSPLSYLSYNVACMSNASGEKSSYFLTYSDTTNNALGGSYFKISEISKSGNTSNTNASVYTVDIGFPTDTNVLGFQLNTQDYWSMVYENTSNLSTWQYGIDNTGQITAQKINLLERSDSFGKDNLINSKWWQDVTEYPISAKLTIKGLVAPAILMSYIDVNVYFYGQKDMTSGLYVVTAQKDSISGSGYTTELTLLRVSS